MTKETLQTKLKEEQSVLNNYDADVNRLCAKYSITKAGAFDDSATIPSELVRAVYFYKRQHNKVEQLQNSLDKLNKKEQVSQVLDLYHNTPDGRIEDCDTILADYMDSVSFEETGLGEEILEIWKSSKDKEAIENLFYTFTGVEFENYLEDCIKKTTKGSIRDSIKAMPDSYYATLICDSFHEAEHNGRTKNIVIIDNSDIYLTYKYDGDFGEFTSWTKEEILEDPDYMMTCITNWIYDVYSRSDKEIHRRIADGTFPLNFEPYELPINLQR